MKSSLLVLVLWLGAALSASAQTSTIRIACDGQAKGAAVTINGRYKADCPFDTTVKPGTVKLRATKKVDGREAVFEETVRIGEGVVKRIEITFGGASVGAVPQVQAVDPREIANRRYQVEMQEYEKNMNACRPRYDEFMMKRARDKIQLERECIAITKADFDADRRTCLCFAPTFQICEAMNKAEEDSKADYNRDSWCGSQFTQPKAP